MVYFGTMWQHCTHVLFVLTLLGIFAADSVCRSYCYRPKKAKWLLNQSKTVILIIATK